MTQIEHKSDSTPDTVYVEYDGKWHEMKNVVHGQWLKALGSMPPEVFGKHVCSVCDHFAPNDHHGKREFLSPVCPYCGAKMDETLEQIKSGKGLGEIKIHENESGISYE